VVDRLLTLLVETNDDGLRSMVVAALGWVGVGSQTVVDRLLTLLNETNDDRLRNWVVAALGQVGVGNQTVVDRLLTLLVETNEDDLRNWVVYALGEVGVGDQTVVDRLLTLLNKTNNDRLCNWVVAALLQLQAGQYLEVPLLLNAVNSSDWRIRQLAVQTLAGKAAQEPAVRQRLLSLLTDDYNVVQVAVEALIALTPAGEREHLLTNHIMPLLINRDRYVRQAVLSAMVKVLPREEAVQRLYMLTQQPTSNELIGGELYNEAYSTLAALLVAEERTYAEAERCPNIKRR